MTLLPLMIFLPGMLRANNQTLIWVGFILLVYFYVAIDNLAGPTPSYYDIIELCLTVLLFTSAMLLARWRQTRVPPATQQQADKTLTEGDHHE